MPTKQEVLDRLTVLPESDMERETLEAELKEIEESEQAMSAINLRFQEQEEKVQSITLPYDFNELYGDSTANDSIIEVVQIFLREAIAEHNNEVQGLIDAHREELKSAEDREFQLKRQNDGLQVALNAAAKQAQADAIQITELERNVSQLELEFNDVVSKREAAVREIEGIELLLKEKQEHIEKLRDEMAIGAILAINVTEVKASDRLAALVEQSKNAKIKSSVELAMERLEPVRGKIEVAVAAPKLPGEATPSVTASNGLDNGQDSGVPANDQAVTFQLPSANTPEVPSMETGMVTRQSEAETDSGVTKAELEERLNQFAQEFGLVKQAVA